MPDSLPPSEFGGKQQLNGVQPPLTPLRDPGHTPTASEKLSLVYRTGSEDGINPITKLPIPDDGEQFRGMLPLAEQIKRRKAEGVIGQRESLDDMVFGRRRHERDD